MDEVDEFLAHYGIKGMRWGRRKSSDNSTSERPKMTPEQKKALAKKVAIGTGTLLLAAGAAYAGHTLTTKGNTPISDVHPTPAAKKTAETILSEPAHIIYASREKAKGFRVIKDGEFPTPISEMEKGFEGDLDRGDYFNRYDGKIAASFFDPEGRKDQAGRVIPHQVIIPKAMADGINDLDDVRKNVWPIIKPDYTYDSRVEGDLGYGR